MWFLSPGRCRAPASQSFGARLPARALACPPHGPKPAWATQVTLRRLEGKFVHRENVKCVATAQRESRRRLARLGLGSFVGVGPARGADLSGCQRCPLQGSSWLLLSLNEDAHGHQAKLSSKVPVLHRRATYSFLGCWGCRGLVAALLKPLPLIFSHDAHPASLRRLRSLRPRGLQERFLGPHG